MRRIVSHVRETYTRTYKRHQTLQAPKTSLSARGFAMNMGVCYCFVMHQCTNKQMLGLNLSRHGSSPLIRMPLFISVYIDLYANSKS